MNLAQLRKTMATRIIVFNVVLLVIAITMYSGDKLATLVGILTPIAAIYFGTLAQHIGQSIRQGNANAGDAPAGPVPYGNMVKWMITLHFLLVLALLLVPPFSLGLNFMETVKVLATVEALFGGYLGYIVSAVFNTQNSST